MEIYTIQDKVAEESGSLFEAINNGIAIRNTVQLLTESNPALDYDYELLHLGSRDTITNEFVIFDLPIIIDFTEALKISRDRLDRLNREV